MAKDIADVLDKLFKGSKDSKSSVKIRVKEPSEFTENFPQLTLKELIEKTFADVGKDIEKLKSLFNSFLGIKKDLTEKDSSSLQVPLKGL